MADPAVVNASPLIFLTRAGLLDLLQLLSSEIIVPEIVASEIEIRGKSDPTARAIANTAWLVVTQVENERQLLTMDCDEEKLDEMVLALLYLTSFTEHGVTRAWKGHDWDVLNRLCEMGLISDPKNKNKSVVLSEEAAKESARLFWKYFGKQR